jgi:3D (Asp-Asp-Asp) domain-containing protein
MGPIQINFKLKEVNTMNVIKTVLKDAYTLTGNVLKVGGTMTTTASSELVKASELLNKAIIATPQVIREVLLIPVTGTAAYIAEDTGVSYSKAEKELLAKLPTSASDAVKQSTIEAFRLIAQLMKDEEAVK